MTQVDEATLKGFPIDVAAFSRIEKRIRKLLKRADIWCEVDEITSWGLEIEKNFT